LRRVNLISEKENIPNDISISNNQNKNERMTLKIIQKNKLKKIDAQEIKKRKIINVEFNIQSKLAFKIQRAFKRYLSNKKIKRLVSNINVI
jgi:hypothetical protein